MAKIKIQTFFKNDEDSSFIKKEFKGILRENQLCYQEDGMKVSITIFENEIVLKRRNLEYSLIFTFSKEHSHLMTHLLNEKQNLMIPIELILLKIENNFIHIIYKINEKKELIIEYEVLS